MLNNSINAKRIFQFIEAPGYLVDPLDDSSLIRSINRIELQALEEKSEGRMKRKIHALNKLVEICDTQVIIADGRVENPIKEAIDGNGTIING